MSRESDQDAPGADAAQEHATLDLRNLPRPQRHRTVIGALEALDAGTQLVIINDHVPHGLKAQLERRYGDRLGWNDIELGETLARVAMWLEPLEGADAARAAADFLQVRVG